MEHLLGKQIGEGFSRTVYQHKEDPSLVIKRARKWINTGDYHGKRDNYTEHHVWKNARKNKKYLAPVTHLSKCHRYLVMKKTTPLDKKYDDNIHPGAGHKFLDMVHKNFPSNMANHYTGDDIHYGNVGKYKNRHVIHDYGGAHGRPVYYNKEP